MSACDSFVPDTDAPWLCASCQFTEIEHNIKSIDEQFASLSAPSPVPAPAPVPMPTSSYQPRNSGHSPQPPPKPVSRPFPPVRSVTSASSPQLNTSGVSPSSAKPLTRMMPQVPPKPMTPKLEAQPGHQSASLSSTPPKPALPKPHIEPAKPLAPKPVALRPSSAGDPAASPEATTSPREWPPKRPAVAQSGMRASSPELSPRYREVIPGAWEGDHDLAGLETTQPEETSELDYSSPRYEVDERSLSKSRDYSLDLEMAPEDNDTPPSSPNFSSTMPSNSSPTSFGGSTFGTGTFGGTRPSTQRRRDSKEVKAFGAHRGIPTPEKRTSGDQTPPVQPADRSANAMEMTMTFSEPEPAPPSPSLSLVSDEDVANATSPRNKAAFGLDSLFKKKKDKGPDKPGDQPKGGLTKITSAFTGKNKTAAKDNKALSKEGAITLQVQQQEERRKREQDYARQLVAIKSAPAPGAGAKRAVQPVRLRRLSRDKGAGIRRPYEDAGAAESSNTKTEPTPGPELDKKREYIIKELGSTEQTYVKSLEDALNTYYKPMIEATKTQKEIPAELINQIFSNMQVILPLNRDHLLKELSERVSNWGPESLIGDIFVRFAPFLKMYTQYNDGFDNAMKALETAAAAPWFLQFCNAKVLIDGLLITPVQRIPRYTLLLEDLWKNTPSSHPDNENLFKAIGLTKKVAAHVNLSVAKNQNFDKLTSEGLEHLLAAHRILVIDGELQVTKIIDFRKAKKSERTKLTYKFLVFNDILVFFDSTIKDKKEVRKKEEIWPLELTWIEKDPGSAEGFNVIGPGGKKLVINTGAPEIFERWWQSLSQAIDKQLDYTQAHLKGQRASFAGCAETLEERKATHTYKSGFFYQGWWVRGNMHGKGSCEFMGSVYEGDFELNKKHGHGTLQYSDGNLFEGEFKNNKPHGRGELSSIEGDRYEGDFVDGKRHGQGEMVWFNGDRYVGEWKEDNINGTGTVAMANGVTYAGQWQNGLYHGEGTLTTAHGTYFGSFQNGVMNGHGNMKWVGKATAVYEGVWKGGMMHGHGVMHDIAGFYEGEWAFGMKKGKGRLVYRDGSVYDGLWEDDKRHGKGSFEDLNGYLKSYKGEWVRDVKQGRGLMTFSTGTTYEGLLFEGLPHGHGILRSVGPEGTVLILDCRWIRGVRDPKCNVTFEDVDGSKSTYFVDDEDEWDELLLPSFFAPISWEH